MGKTLKSALSKALPVAMLLLPLTNSRSAEIIENDKGDTLIDADAALMRQVRMAADAGDCPTILKLLTPRLARHPRIASDAAYAYLMAASCATRGKDFKGARRYALTGTETSASNVELWHVRLALDLQSSDVPAAVTTIEVMSSANGKALSDIPISWLGDLNQRLLEKNLEKERLRFLAVVADPGFAPSEPLASNDGFRQAYVNILYENGQLDKAAKIVAAIEHPRIMTRLKADPRFRSMVPRDFDERAAFEQRLNQGHRAIKLKGDQLTLLMDASRNLRALGRPEESLSLLKTAEQRPGGVAGYRDAAQYLNLWWDALGLTYLQLGNYEQMVDAFRHGALIGEAGNLNVSQIINLASLQIDFGKPQDALATIAEFKLDQRPMSPFGTMQMRYARGCASALTGKTGQAKADLSYMRAHEKDGPGTLADMLLCMKDMDGAAELFIRLLKDPEQSVGTLLGFSDFDPPVPTEPVSPIFVTHRAVRERPDVRAAIDHAGGVLRIHAQPDGIW